jgi:sortase A
MPELLTATISPAQRRRVRAAPLRRALRAFSTVLIVTGALLLVDAGLTVAWQEPVSAIYASIRQSNLRGELRTLERVAPTPVEVSALTHVHDARRRIAFLARSLERGAPEGSAVGRIHIPHIGVNFVVVKGTSSGDLESGPGIYPQTRFPGVPGTTAIAGHRTTYLAPFRHINAVRRGDQVVIDMPYARFTYSVQDVRVVLPTDIAVINSVGYDRLVLSACTPLYSATKRIVVLARLVASEPLGAARA